MKCPKCHYVGFDSGDRCRNCGYDFSLAAAPQAGEVPIRAAEPIGPLADLTLAPPSNPAADNGMRQSTDELLDIGESAVVTTAALSELPLFPGEDRTERSYVTPPAARSPLAVRRATPEPARSRSRPLRRKAEAPELDLDPALTDDPIERNLAPVVRSSPTLRSAGALDRALAALVDVLLIAAIDVVVLYLTLRLCDLTAAEIAVLPKAPLLGFFALLNGGYFVAFTLSSGQTIGKMLRGIKVIGKNGPVLAGQTILRTAAYGASALPLGLGFVAGLVGRERLALHDRLADTRVVKVAP